MPLVPANVIGLVGIAPIGGNDLTLITNQRDANTTYGQEVPGFTIPQSLKAAFDNGASAVLVVNVFDATTMTTEESDESHVIANGRAKLTHAPIGAVVLTNQAGNVTFENGVDYKVDVYGNITVLDPTVIANGATVLATYDRLDATAITSAVIIGAIDGNDYSGMKLFQVARSRFGFGAKILIAPKYCEVAAVASEMITLAGNTRAVAFIDGPSAVATSDSVSDVVQERGPSGTYAGFQSTSKRVNLLWPHVKKTDPSTGGTVTFGQSAYWAGVQARLNFWRSASNQAPRGVLGLEVDITGAINATGTDANTLNGAGINTMANISGLRTWGNRNANFPGEAGAETFVSTTRIRDILEESTELAMLPFVDQPISSALITAITETVNTFIRSLVQRGAIVDGECFFDLAQNPPAQIANGQLVFTYEFAPTTPAERITFNSVLDINLLAALTA